MIGLEKAYSGRGDDLVCDGKRAYGDMIAQHQFWRSR
jgi:hypothetical protein